MGKTQVLQQQQKKESKPYVVVGGNNFLQYKNTWLNIAMEVVCAKHHQLCQNKWNVVEECKSEKTDIMNSGIRPGFRS